MAQNLRISLSELAIGGMKQVEDGKAKVLFVRDGDGVRAFQAMCPHYGAPLAKGEICGAKLYCPWHKAVFDIGDGAVMEPPALTGLKRFPVTIDGDQAIASLDGQPAKPDAAPRMAGKTFVIVGTGAAAVAAVTTLRRDGFAGRIVMIGREDAEPYDRPKLSKNFLAKATPPEAVTLEDGFYKSHHVDYVNGFVTRVDTETKTVVLADGRVIEGDAVLIATGSRAAEPSFPGVELGGVYTLRSIRDAVVLSDVADKAKRIAIIGGGFIGLEAAAFLTKRGLEATVISPNPIPLASRFGDAVGKGLKAYHEKNGVRFVQGKIKALVGDGDVRAVALDNGSDIPAEMVLLATGAKPETAMIQGAALRDDGGVTVAADLSIRPGVYCAGDIAAFPERISGQTARIEHWRLAEQHGAHAARAMLGQSKPFAGTPFFWSNQGDKRLDYAGYAKDWDRIILDGDADALDFIAYYIKAGRAVAACSIGRNPAFIAYLNRLDEGHVPTEQDVRL